jgi:hypothetical protein
LKELVQTAEDAEEGEPAQQSQSRSGAAVAGGQPHESEPDSEEEREDREEPVLYEVLVEAVEVEGSALDPEFEHRRQVDQQNPAQGEAADDVEFGDPGPGPGR